MHITLNNQPRELIAPCTLQQLLEQLGLSAQKGIAVAINDTVVPRENWSDHVLQEKDEVLIIKATQGG
jgi:sulfur carrier protein